MYFSSITTLVLISLVVIIWMLIPSWLSAANIRLATPTTDDARLPVVLRRTSGFVYYVSITGITGSPAAASTTFM